MVQEQNILSQLIKDSILELEKLHVIRKTLEMPTEGFIASEDLRASFSNEKDPLDEIKSLISSIIANLKHRRNFIDLPMDDKVNNVLDKLITLIGQPMLAELQANGTMDKVPEIIYNELGMVSDALKEIEDMSRESNKKYIEQEIKFIRAQSLPVEEATAQLEALRNKIGGKSMGKILRQSVDESFRKISEYLEYKIGTIKMPSQKIKRPTVPLGDKLIPEKIIPEVRSSIILESAMKILTSAEFEISEGKVSQIQIKKQLMRKIVMRNRHKSKRHRHFLRKGPTRTRALYRLKSATSSSFRSFPMSARTSIWSEALSSEIDESEYSEEFES